MKNYTYAQSKSISDRNHVTKNVIGGYFNYFSLVFVLYATWNFSIFATMALFGPGATEITVILFMLGMLLLSTGFKYLFAFIKMRKVYLRLKKICRQWQFTLETVGHPLLSAMWTRCSGYYRIQTPQKVFLIEPLSCAKRRDPVFLSGDHTAIVYSYLLSLYGMQFFGRPKLLHLELEEASDAEKILMISPVPRKLFSFRYRDGTAPALSKRNFLKASTMRQLLTTPIDNADRVGDYTVFSGNAFANYLDRSADTLQ